MKELDFDELDRAVNSLMTDVAKTDAPDEDKEKTLTITPSSTSNALPSSDLGTPSTTTPPAVTPTEVVSVRSNNASTSRTASPVSVAARRGGRFMDVVHPSSDMKNPETTRTSVSRQGVTIAPDASASVPAEPSTPPPVQPTTEPDTPQPAASIEPTFHEESEWPDPLELADFKDTSAPEKTDETIDQPDATADKGTSDEPSPLTSPFIPGTKVEKRPLGGASPLDEPVSSEQPRGAGKEDLTVDDPSAQLPATPSVVVEQPLPEELQNDLVAIESGGAAGTISHPDAPAEDTVPVAAPKPADKPTPELLSAGSPKEPASTPTVPVSIPQQYREEPSTGEATSGAIYDTDTYHQPLAHPGRKKSGWMWVIWIVLIILLGAGVGAALYFFGII